MSRKRIVETLNDLIGFAEAVASRVAGSKSVEVQIKATDDDVEDKWCELWAHAPLLYKPVAGAEQLYVELGDERVVIATKDRRWQIATADGEVVLRSMGPGTPAYVKLKPDGSAEIYATSINLGGSASVFVALASLVDARLSAIVTWLNSHTHTASGSPTTSPVTPIASQATVAATKVKAE